MYSEITDDDAENTWSLPFRSLGKAYVGIELGMMLSKLL